MVIYLDFDGTIVEHAYPLIGAYNPGCFEVIQKLQQAGHEIVLNTVRTDMNDGTLQQAFDFLNKQTGNRISAITESTEHKFHPGIWDWKFFEKNLVIFIDDICKGIPLRETIIIKSGKMVDWPALDAQFIERNIYGKTGNKIPASKIIMK